MSSLKGEFEWVTATGGMAHAFCYIENRTARPLAQLYFSPGEQEWILKYDAGEISTGHNKIVDAMQFTERKLIDFYLDAIRELKERL